MLSMSWNNAGCKCYINIDYNYRRKQRYILNMIFFIHILNLAFNLILSTLLFSVAFYDNNTIFLTK